MPSVLDRIHLPALVRVRRPDGAVRLALWRDGVLRELPRLSLDALLARPLDDIRDFVEAGARSRRRLDPGSVDVLAPVESQEVWAAGVTYLRSREARREESASKDVYSQVYEAERPELFFKASGWRVVGPGGDLGIRSDSSWDVPEPELAVLSNRQGEVVAYAIGNDMSSRSIEGENPLYLPQAKVYDRSCGLGPVAVLAWHADAGALAVRMTIEREGKEVFAGEASTASLVREPAAMIAVLRSCYTLPAGAWLLTGTGIVPPQPYTARNGDLVRIEIEGMGELENRLTLVRASGARATAKPVAFSRETV
jgi:2-dehydro-3-deoxy-D-arabinonate dehydratase